MQHTTDHWLGFVKLDIWKEGHVNGVGHVKLSKDALFGTKKQLFDDDLFIPHTPVSNGVFLDEVTQQSSKTNYGGAIYKVIFKVHNKLQGNWETRSYTITTGKKDTWLQQLIGADKKISGSRDFILSRKTPFEKKISSNQSVFGFLLPKPKNFKR